MKKSNTSKIICLGAGMLAVLTLGLSAQTNPVATALNPAALCGVNNCVFPNTIPPTLPPQPSLKRLTPNTVSYTAFNGAMYSMKEFIGKDTAVLIRDSDLQIFTEAQAWELVDQADFLYETFKELMGVEPLGGGLLRIAFVDNCGAGCGYIGYKGVELQPYFASGGVWFARGDLTDLYPYLVHEMTHNFDRWSSYVMFGADIAHSWTAFMDAYIVAANQQGQVANSGGGRGFAPAEFLKKRVDEFFLPYLNAPGSTWSTCVRDAACTNVNAAATQGGFAARLAQLIGPKATQKAMFELRDAATTRGLNPSAMTAEQKNDLLLECFSRGAQTNLSCLVPTLRWAITAGMQTQLNSLFGTNDSLCNDTDGDGYTPVQGDLNDGVATIHPGATELPNGIDDDCDGVVDNVAVSEITEFPNNQASAVAVPFPCRIIGSISSASDDDNFKVTLPVATRVRFTLKSEGAFAGWIFIYEPGGGWLTYAYCGANAKSDLDVLLPAGEWKFSVSQNILSAPGNYELACGPIDAEWPTYFYPGRAGASGSNSWQLISPALPPALSGTSNVQARFWASGFGWVGTNSVTISNSTSYGWLTPSNLPPSETTYRVHFYQGGLPAWRATEARPLSGGFQLTIKAATDGNVLLNWPATSPGLSVFSAPSFGDIWGQVTNAVQFTNGKYQIATPQNAGNLRFFRLQGL